MTEIFHQQFPFYLAMGMTCSEYWEGSSWLVKGFRQADRLKQQRASDEAWLQGMYIYNALCVALSNAFMGKGKQPQKYMEKPIDIVPKTEEEKKQEVAEEKNKVIDYLMSLKASFDRKHEGNTDG